MNIFKKNKGTELEIRAFTSIRMDIKALGRKLPLLLLAGTLELFLGLNSPAAAEEPKSTLVFVNTLVADRERFDALLVKEFPKAKVLYTSVDANVNDDVRDEIVHGVSPDGLKKYSSLVIIGDFKKATVPQASVNLWMTDTFASAKKHQAPQLHLLSTSRKPPATYLRWVKISGGEYRQLKSTPNGSYE